MVAPARRADPLPAGRRPFFRHADEMVLVFDSGGDAHSDGVGVSAEAFVAALASVDDPPRIVVLNACNSEPQLTPLLGSAQIAIGMSDSIGDEAAIAFAARLYSANRGRPVGRQRVQAGKGRAADA
jgi:hypothetical protein